MFTVVEVRAISDELADASNGWLTPRGLPAEVDTSWLELVLEDGDQFRPDEMMLHLAVPPTEVAIGDLVNPGKTETVGQAWPTADAPEEEAPKVLALARALERDEDKVWIGSCRLPPPVKELFTVEHPDAMLSVMTATRRTLSGGTMSISGDPEGRLRFTVVEDNFAAWGSMEARVNEAFSYWLQPGPSLALATPLKDATKVVGSLGVMPDLILINETGVEARCPFGDPWPDPKRLPEDYFAGQAEGGVDGLRVDRQGGIGREALAAIASFRPGNVTLTVAEDASLVISGSADDTDTFKLDGPGFAALNDRRSIPIVVPYAVALAIYDGAAGGAVDLTVDAQWGRLYRADQGITVQWTR